jgi:hypothetical protein
MRGMNKRDLLVGRSYDSDGVGSVGKRRRLNGREVGRCGILLTEGKIIYK